MSPGRSRHATRRTNCIRREYYDKGRTQWSQYVDKGKELIQTQSDAVSAAVDAGKQAYTQKTGSETPQA